MRRQPQLRRFFLITLLSFILLTPVTCLRAQDYVTGAFEGQVTDGVSNAPLAGATVQIINKDSGVPVARQTDSQGRFRQGLLPPGDYIIRVSLQGYTTYEREQGLPALRPTPMIPIPVKLQREVAAVTTSAPTEALGVRAASLSEEGIRAEINTTDAQRGGTFSRREVSTLPLGGTTLTRTFDELGLLLPGVAPPPQTQGGVAGPGIGAGVGSAGEFAVNGLRSRANNFTMDGSDNNDEDIGVRRQGFLALVPQSVESIQEYQVITLLAPAQYGRNFGAQVNAVSKSGTSSIHGTFFGFLNTSQLNARNFFDTTNGNAVTPLQANGQDVLLENQTLVSPTLAIIISTQPLTVRNGSGGKESSTLAQAGFVLGGPLVPADPADEKSGSLFYFVSVEGQWLNATKEASFIVPTIAQRGLFNSGVTGVFRDQFSGDRVNRQSQSRAGAAIFSLFPFPNNPTGIYGVNTLTRTLPASGFSKILSGKTNGNFYAGGKRHDITARYNLTDDARTVPVTGDALFSSLRPRVRTQNLSSFLTSAVTNNIANEVRASYGRTRLVFDDVPDREFLIPSQKLPNEPFLLNAPYIQNKTRPFGSTTDPSGLPNTGPVRFFRRPNDPARSTSEFTTGPIGQVKVAGFSSLGVDVFNFPQRRVNNTYQVADTLSVTRGTNRLAFGEDIRRVELNSDLPRNSRTLLEYAGQFGSDQTVSSDRGPVLITPQDLVAAGAPTGARQTINTTPGDSTIHLRYYGYAFFGQDEWRVRPNLSLSLGLRYEYDSPPRELDSRIENVLTGATATSLIPALKTYFDGRTSIYDPERTNFMHRLGIAYAWRLFGSDRETVFRAGYGKYYDQVIGSVVSQSRNVFPNFLTLDTGGGLEAQRSTVSQRLTLFPPSAIGFCRDPACLLTDPLVQPGTLNRLNPAVSLTALLQRIKNRFADGGFGVTLPTRRLKTPSAKHYTFTIEQPLGKNLAVSLAYVGTRGRHLLRLNTPNAGENLGIVLSDFDPDDVDDGGDDSQPQLFGRIFAPSAPSSPSIYRPSGLNSTLGAVNLIETSANSRYDALQVQLRGRFMRGLQFQAAYTFGKATDDVSDFFDMAGASSLPQDFTDLAAERGPANFDTRHRVSHNLIFTLPDFAASNHAFRSVFGGLEVASTGQFQTGQPFTVNSIFDVNGDGNFTDRLNSTNGLVVTGNGRQPLQLTGPAAANPSSLLALNFTDGKIGRNSFRADKLWLTNVAVVKNISLSEQFKLVFRTEIFNIFNRANYGVPVRFLEAPGFGKATDTVTPGRRIQFGLKLAF